MREANNIEELGALPIDYVGFIFYPKSPRYVAQRPSCTLPSSIQKVGVFVNATKEEILNKVKDFDLQVVQLHGNESPEFCAQIGQAGLCTFKAFGIDEDFDWAAGAPYIGKVDYFLFDTKSKHYGGTGLSFDWEVLKSYPYHTPYWLSGGLSTDNLVEACRFEDERLYGFDLNSKFEIEPGIKNIDLLTQAITIIK